MSACHLPWDSMSITSRNTILILLIWPVLTFSFRSLHAEDTTFSTGGGQGFGETNLDGTDPFAQDGVDGMMDMDGGGAGSEPAPPARDASSHPTRENVLSARVAVREELTPAVTLIEAKDFEGAVTTLDEVRKNLRPADLDGYHYLRGLALYNLNKYDQAVGQLERSLSYRARNSDALHLLGSIAVTKKAWPLAERHLTEAVWLATYQDYTPSASWLLLSQVFEALGKTDKVAQAIQNGAGASGKGGGVDTKGLIELIQKQIQSGDIELARRAANSFEPKGAAEALEKETLLAQIALLSPKKVFFNKELKNRAESLEKALVSSTSEELPKDALSSSYEQLVRLWILSGDNKKAAEALQSGTKYLEGKPSYRELTKQLQQNTPKS